FAGAHDHAGAADGAGSPLRGEARAEVVGRGDEVITENDGGFVAVEAVDGLAPAAGVGFVQDIVVDQGGHVDHFADGGDGQVVLGDEGVKALGGLGVPGQAAEDD